MKAANVLKGTVFVMSVVLLSVMSTSAFGAAATRLSSAIDHQSLSVRALGMGGALTAAVDDYNALSYNPAALAFLESYQIHGTIGAGIDSDVLTVFDDVSKATETEGSDTEKQLAIAAAIEKNFGKEPYLRLTPLYGAWVWKGMGFSFTPADITVELALDQQVGPSIEVATTADTTFAFGYGREIKSSKAKMAWGVTAKVIHRVFYQDTLTTALLLEDSDYFNASDATEGLTVDFDMGFHYEPKISPRGFLGFFRHLKPAFAVVARNVIDYGFTTNLNIVDPNSGEPPKLGRRFDVGTKFQIPKFWVFTPRFAFDVRDIGHDNWTFKKGYHAGFELDWFVGNLLRGAWRVGLNQGYFTAGVTAKLLWFELGAATWGEEIGTSAKTKENRRYLVNLSLDF